MRKAIIYYIPEVLAILIISVALLTAQGEKAPDKNQQTIKPISLGCEKINVSIGTYTVTAYCPCEKCCNKNDGITSTGVKATAKHTLAVDPTVIPYGTEIIIDGVKYIAEDCGGKVKGNKVDIYFASHQEAVEFGVQEKELFIEGEKWYAK